MKKILIIFLISFSVFTLSAASYDTADGFGLGFSAGYPVTGGIFRYGIGDFRILGTLGYRFNDSFTIKAGVQYDIARFYVENLPFYVNIGVTGAASFSPVAEGFTLNIPVGISYFLMDAPVELFFKLIPSFKILSASTEPGFGAAFGFLYYLHR